MSLQTPEPFGYFRCTLDGWIDCAETDEGARPLYEYAEIAKRDAEIDRLNIANEQLIFQIGGVELAEQDAQLELTTLRREIELHSEANANLEQMIIELSAKLAGVEKWIETQPHGDNCYLGDELSGNRCYCGKESILDYIATYEEGKKG